MGKIIFLYIALVAVGVGYAYVLQEKGTRVFLLLCAAAVFIGAAAIIVLDQVGSSYSVFSGEALFMKPAWSLLLSIGSAIAFFVPIHLACRKDSTFTCQFVGIGAGALLAIITFVVLVIVVFFLTGSQLSWAT